jgi:hypothetical protein
MLFNGGAVNLMLYSMFKKLGKEDDCDRTTSEMRGPSSRIQIRRLDEGRMLQTHIQSIQNYNFIEN